MMHETDVAHFRAFGFTVVRGRLNGAALRSEVEHALAESRARAHFTALATFRFVPMMTARTPLSLALVDELEDAASLLLGGAVLPIRAKGVRYSGTTRWHRDSPDALRASGSSRTSTRSRRRPERCASCRPPIDRRRPTMPTRSSPGQRPNRSTRSTPYARARVTSSPWMNTSSTPAMAAANACSGGSTTCAPLGRLDNSLENLERVIREVCAADVEPDGMVAAGLRAPWILRLLLPLITRGAYAGAAKAGARLVPILSVPSAAGLERIARAAESTSLRIAIDKVFAFEALGAAFDHLESGKARGRIVLKRS